MGFHVTLANNTQVSFKGAHNKYVVAESDKKTVQANRDAAGPWEKFTVVSTKHSSAFRSSHGKLLSAQPNGTLEGNRDSAGAWENLRSTSRAMVSSFALPTASSSMLSPMALWLPTVTLLVLGRVSMSSKLMLATSSVHMLAQIK